MTSNITPNITLPGKLLAEAIGTAFLLIAVVGSGIMADNLSDGNDGLALLANAIATGAALFVLIEVFGPISGAHFNPVVTMVMAMRGDLSRAQALPYIGTQILAGALGVILANIMFGLPAIHLSETARSGTNLWISEIIASFGLVFLILILSARGAKTVGAAVGLYITGAYFFTSSTSFANPAVTLARTLSDTFAGIAPGDAPLFILMQIIGALLAFITARTQQKD